MAVISSSSFVTVVESLVMRGLCFQAFLISAATARAFRRAAFSRGLTPESPITSQPPLWWQIAKKLKPEPRSRSRNAVSMRPASWEPDTVTSL
jgi:hypothetical protein